MMAVVFGMLVATLAGTSICALLARTANLRSHLPGLISAGFFFGVGLVALMQLLPDALGLRFQPWRIVIVLVLVSVASLMALLFHNRRHTGHWRMPARVLSGPGNSVLRRSWEFRVEILLSAIMVVLAWMLIDEGLSRPIFPWDAWSAWSVKAKVWMGLGKMVDFVSFREWLVARDASLYVNEAWRYPETIPLYQLWLVQLYGQWNDRIAVLPWAGMWISAHMAFYHGMRACDVSRLFSLGACLVLLTTPIIAVQIALPGYMDVWLGTALIAATSWAIVLFRERSVGLAIVVGLLLMFAAAIKLEGSVWAVALLGGIVMGFASSARRRYIYVGLACALLLWIVSGGFSFTLLGIEFTATLSMLELPYIGTVRLAVSNPTAALTSAFLVLANWNLLWYAIPLTFIFAHRGLSGSGLQPMFSAFCVFGGGFLVLVFYFTHASVWVESMTASNRLALQFAMPLTLWLSIGIYRYAYADKTPE